MNTQEVGIGDNIKDVIKKKGIVVKQMLKNIQDKYPDERGLTENGFKYSLDNQTIKVGLLFKVCDELGVHIIDVLPDTYKFTSSELSNRLIEINNNIKRVQELEMDKSIYVRQIQFLEGRIVDLENQLKSQGKSGL